MENLSRLLGMQSVNNFYAVVQSLGFNAVECGQLGLESAYSTAHVACPVELTRVLEVLATSIRWKGEVSKDDGESKPTKGCSTETRQRPVKATHRRGSRSVHIYRL